MDDERFDDLARNVYARHSRRGLMLGAVALTLSGAATLPRQDDVTAGKNRKKGKNKKKKRPPAIPPPPPPPCPACAGTLTRVPGSCDCCAGAGTTCLFDTCCGGECFKFTPQDEGTCLGLADGAACTFDAQCAGGYCANGECSPFPHHCRDGRLSANETDVDCGAACPPCVVGKRCSGAIDCRSALCVSGRCAACTSDAMCGSDLKGPCSCLTHAPTDEKRCAQKDSAHTVGACDECESFEICWRIGTSFIYCSRLCGAP
jgi:hypothetical protein